MSARAASLTAIALSDRATLPLYVAVLATLEWYLVFVDTYAGTFALVALVVVMVNHHIFRPASVPSHGVDSLDGSAAIAALALVPVIQLVNVTVPIVGLEDVYQYGLTTAPVLAAAVWALVAARPLVPRTSRREPSGLPTGVAGIVLGLGAYVLIEPAELAQSNTARDLVVAISVVSAAAVADEVVFRGVIQGAIAAAYPRSAALWSTAVYVISSLAVRPAELIVLAAIVGLVFGLGVQRTKSLAGAVAGHVVLNIGLFVIWPAVLG